MALLIACPSCTEKLRLPDTLQGKRVKCPKCTHIFVAQPETADEPAQASPQEPLAPAERSTTQAQVSKRSVTASQQEVVAQEEPKTEPDDVPADEDADDLMQEKLRKVTGKSRPKRKSRYEDDEDDRPKSKRKKRRSSYDYDDDDDYDDDFDDDEDYDRSSRRQRMRRDLEPDRGGLVLSLGIVGLVTAVCTMPMGVCCGGLGVLLSLLGLGLSIPAWSMGASDLRRMRAGEIDREGEGQTRGGMVCGIVGTCIGALDFILSIVMLTLILTMR